MPLSVEKIENGTVIDHITPGKGLRVLGILQIDSEYKGRVALVMNVPSKHIGKKDIVKIEGKLIDDKTADKIALISPNATLNLIKNSEVIEKRNVKLPKVLTAAFKCPNPKCITNAELVETKFLVEKETLKCYFCERYFKAEELK
ncbi:aspartate carbamoyltransferase regulatory subunit [Candidatus Micrarchaeota archaeon]|nr:aspartate carbamoyltransferase regulatory subunit [Candidatus Micrarchaeota archaeon]